MIVRVVPTRIGVRVSPFVTPDGVALAIEFLAVENGGRAEAPPAGRAVTVRTGQVARAAELLARREIRDWFKATTAGTRS